MEIISLKDIPKERIFEFFRLQWGSPKMVVSSGVYDGSTLDGFTIINEENEIIGLVTYIIKAKESEIISLDSLKEGKGIGTSLIQAVESVALQNQCRLVKVITTNDNLLGLKFYQKRGFVLSKIHKNAVQRAREIKPEIPLIGNDGIPIRDEIELEKLLA
ncbi:GNAT family N-acetyltransferase [Pseudalkalibacillus sp. SCS-8]|uniref:GNAT family N-acetyltransferase n=1 Tax=Pseudalkalibacillus nanhaiensis TaxID=3115291 RepID=UPI0032DA695C